MASTPPLNGRVTLIAGGGGEIGGAIARRFAEAGAAIAIADLRRDSAEAVAAEIAAAGGQAVAVRTNVAVDEDAARAVRHAVEAFGKLTTLVNVAATVTPDGTVETLTLDDWNSALAGLRAIAAEARATILAKAAAKFGSSVPARDRAKRIAALRELEQRTGKPFNDLDDEFYAADEDLDVLLALYAVKNKAHFTDSVTPEP